MLFNSDQQAENKLIILYVLKQMKTALSREQIALVIIENLQITYFDIQFYIDDLIKDQFISTLNIDDKIVLNLTHVGKESISIFKEKIPAYIREMIDLYLKKNYEKIFKEVRVSANYSQQSESEYIVELKLHENNLLLMEISISAPNLKLALDICKRWKENTQKLYASVLEILTL